MSRTRNRSLKLPKPALYALELPQDVSGRFARLTVVGSSRALVENHGRIVEITPECVRLATGAGLLCFQGARLSLRDVCAGSLLVCGRIETITLPADEEADDA